MPKGGIFLWIKLPAEVDVRKLVKPAADAGIVFNPGPEWAVSADNSSIACDFALPCRANRQFGMGSVSWRGCVMNRREFQYGVVSYRT